MKKILFITFLVLVCSCTQEEKNPDTEMIQKNEGIESPTQNLDTAIVQSEMMGMCYEQKFGPMGKENIFRVNLIEKDKEVTGLLEYIFFGEQPIAGTIIGQIKESGEINVLFSYVQDGVPQYQKVYFKKINNLLLQRSGELVEERGILDLKDKQAPFTDTFRLVPCTKSFI